MKFQPGLEVSWLGFNSAGAKVLVTAAVNVNNKYGYFGWQRYVNEKISYLWILGDFIFNSFMTEAVIMLHKSMDWFRYHNGLRHERVNVWVIVCLLSMSEKIRRNDTLLWNSKAKHLIEKIIAEIEVWVKHQCRNDRLWRDMWSPQFPFDLWKKNVRMSREEFIELCE